MTLEKPKSFDVKKELSSITDHLQAKLKKVKNSVKMDKFNDANRICEEFLNRFYNSLVERGVDFSLDTIEKELISFCLDVKGKENRLCYYLGATKDATTKILSEVTRPVSVHMLAMRICEKLEKMDSQICELKYEKKLDLISLDLQKVRVAELKQILHSWGEECRACAVKTDYVNLIKVLAPQYAAMRSQTEL